MSEKKEKEKIKDGLLFIMPLSLIRHEHLTRRDVISIKKSLCRRLGIASIFTAGLLFVFSLAIFISLGLSSSWNNIEVYGIHSFIGTFVVLFGSLATIVLQIASRVSEDERVSYILARIGGDLLFICASAYMLLALYSDAAAGYTSGANETLSASLLLVAIIILVQPAFWLDAIILDIGYSLTLIAITISCHFQYDMGALGYYMFLALGFPLVAYLIVSVLFFAEASNYCQRKRNEILFASASHDELTKCKNRMALTSFIEENQKRWESRETNLLLIMFDIDCFKEYNDQFSHLAGDAVLRQIAETVRILFPSPDLDFFRYGGEEFLLFFELRNPGDAIEIMEKLRIAIRDVKIPAPVGAPEEYLTISLGGSLIRTTEGFSFETSLEKVDKYLYKAKRSGKNLSCLDDRLIERS